MNKLRNSKLAQAGFSLVELLIVIAVIAVIAALAIPQFTGARDAAVASRESYNAQAFLSMSNQLRALGYTNAITVSNLQAGVTVSVTNATNGVNNVVFQLQ